LLERLGENLSSRSFFAPVLSLNCVDREEKRRKAKKSQEKPRKAKKSQEKPRKAKRDPSTSQAGCFAGAKQKSKCAGLLRSG
jgi:hypothetical protein